MQQLKISEWLDKLPEPWRTQALSNFKSQGKMDKICTHISDAVNEAFVWRKTTEGDAYWTDVSNKLEYGEVLTQPTPTIQVHKLHLLHIPQCEVLAYSDHDNGILFGRLVKTAINGYGCVNLDGSFIDDITHYIHASDLLTHFKTAQDAQDEPKL